MEHVAFTERVGVNNRTQIVSTLGLMWHNILCGVPSAVRRLHAPLCRLVGSVMYLAVEGGGAVAETDDRKRVDEDFTEDPRYAASRREMIISFVYFGVYTFVLIAVAWVIGGGKDADEIGFILGFPDWFFWSAFVGGLLFSVVPYFLVKYFFEDMPLSASGEDSEAGEDESSERPSTEASPQG